MTFYHVTVKKKMRTSNSIETEVAKPKEMGLNLN